MIDDKPRKSRKIVISGEVGFPSNIYYGLISEIGNMGYNMKKTEDWIEVNPRSDYYQEFVQKRSNLEQQVSRLMKNISDMRKQVEMLRHDRRKIDRILKHHEKGDLKVLKSDFVDLVDKHTGMSMLDLANSGRFPSIVVDFYKIEDEEDIDDLNVSRGEKEVLRKKWVLFQDWMSSFVRELKDRKRLIDSELRNKKKSVEHYKELLNPYLKAMERIKVNDKPDYQTLEHPAMVQTYSTSVSGVELIAWKEMWPDGNREYLKGNDDFMNTDFGALLHVKIERLSVVKEKKKGEEVDIKINGHVKKAEEIKKIVDKVDRKNKELMKNIKELKGEEFDEELGELEEFDDGDENESFLSSLLESIDLKLRKKLSAPKEGVDDWLPFRVSGVKGHIGDMVEEEVDELYDRLKEKIDGLKTERAG